MDDEEALLLDTIPSLPSGRKVHVFAKGSSHGQVFNDIESLKQEVENRLNNDLWDSWKRKNPDLHTQPQDVSDLLSSGVSLPEPVVYGKIIATGDSLFAYPALVPKRWDEGFCIVYLRDKNEAATKHAETVESFESRREYFMKKQAEKQEIDSMQEEVEVLSSTDIEIYKQRADNQDLLYNFLDAVRETKNFLYRKVPDSARTGIKRASDYLAEIKKEEQKYMDSDASIREVVHGGLLEELRTVLGVYADIEGIKSGRVTVSPDVFKRIDFADDNQVIVSEVVAEDDSGSNYTVVQVAVDRSGRVLLADDSEKMTLEGDDLVWNDGVANKVWVEDYEVFYSDEEFRRREQGVPDDSYFEGRSVEDLEDEYSNADSSEYKEVARRHLIFALEEKIRSSDMPFEIAVLQAKLKDFQKG